MGSTGVIRAWGWVLSVGQVTWVCGVVGGGMDMAFIVGTYPGWVCLR